MSDKAIVLDANILVRAVLGKRVRGLNHTATIAFYAPDVAYSEEIKGVVDDLTGGQGLLKSISRLTVIRVLKSIDSSYAVSKKKPYPAVNSEGYEVDLLAARRGARHSQRACA